MAGEFVPGSRPEGPDCVNRISWGLPSNLANDYIAKIYIPAEDDYPSDACTPYKYHKAKIDDFEITNSLTGDCGINIGGDVTAGGHTLSSKKTFDIPHPTKEGWRLRHVCLEGPEAGVYFRGRVTNRNEIELPAYWKGLVDWTTITVSLTPIGSHQDVIIKRWDENKIYLQAMGRMPIDCFYHVYGERQDGERVVVEYEGTSISDYPGDETQYTVNK